MITINATKIEKCHFPDGTQRLTDIPFNDFIHSDLVWIDWKYENLLFNKIIQIIIR